MPRRYRYDEQRACVVEVRTEDLFLRPLPFLETLDRSVHAIADRLLREAVFGVDLGGPHGDRSVFVAALPPVIAGALLFASEALPPGGILIVESEDIRPAATVQVAQPPLIHVHDARLDQFMRTFAAFVRPYLLGSDGRVEGENREYSPGETAKHEELTATLLDLAKQGRKEDFKFLATAEAQVPVDEAEEFWSGTRKRLNLPV